jgi:hypothetical protein
MDADAAVGLILISANEDKDHVIDRLKTSTQLHHQQQVKIYKQSRQETQFSSSNIHFIHLRASIIALLCCVYDDVRDA